MPESAKRRLVENATPASEQSFAGTELKREQQFGSIRTVVRSVAAVMRVAQSLWPQKPAYELSFRTGASLRAAEYWLAGERELGTEAFVALLRSDEGYQFLEAVMTAIPAHARPAWWRKLSRNASRAEIRRQQAVLGRQIEALEREEQLDLELRLKGPDTGKPKQGEPT